MIALPDVRSLLFVPASREERFDKAAGSGADAVILDLEDAVAPQDKVDARAAARRWLSARSSRTDVQAIVRINPVGTEWHDADLAMAGALGCHVLLPKADDVGRVHEVRAALPDSARLLALVETARGVRDAGPLCASGAVDRVAFGSVDFAVELGIDPESASLAFDHARAVLVVASAAAGLPAPWDGVTTAVGDPARLAADVAASLAAGFGGKLAIHPGQVTPINQAWTPTTDEVGWARRIMLAVDTQAGGVIVVDGKMVDAPVVTRARQLLRRAGLE